MQVFGGGAWLLRGLNTAAAAPGAARGTRQVPSSPHPERMLRSARGSRAPGRGSGCSITSALPLLRGRRATPVFTFRAPGAVSQSSAPPSLLRSQKPYSLRQRSSHRTSASNVTTARQNRTSHPENCPRANAPGAGLPGSARRPPSLPAGDGPALASQPLLVQPGWSLTFP